MNPDRTDEASEKEGAVKELADKTMAASVIAQISTLPQSATVSDKEAVEAARGL